MDNIIHDVHECDRSFEVKGISGDIQKYLYEDMTYPCYILFNTPENGVSKSKLQALKILFDTVESCLSDLPSITVYFTDQTGSEIRTLKLGSITAKQVKSFLRLFKDNVVVGKYNADTDLRGDYLYVLSE